MIRSDAWVKRFDNNTPRSTERQLCLLRDASDRAWNHWANMLNAEANDGVYTTMDGGKETSQTVDDIRLQLDSSMRHVAQLLAETDVFVSGIITGRQQGESAAVPQ